MKYSTEQVELARSLRRKGVPLKEIAEKTGIKKGSIRWAIANADKPKQPRREAAIAWG